MFYSVTVQSKKEFFVDSNGIYREKILKHCKHKHRTIQEAYGCFREVERLNRRLPEHERWINPKVTQFDGSELSQDERDLLSCVNMRCRTGEFILV